VKEILNSFKQINKYFQIYRLHSEYYIKFSYFLLFSIIILFYSRYIVNNNITPVPIITLCLAFLVFIFIPLGGIYYIIKSSISMYKISKKQFDENIVNNRIWLSDLIYLFLTLYVIIINYFPVLISF